MTVLTPSAKDLKAIEAPFDVQAIRADFPILSRKVNGKNLVYLDNGASAQKPRVVLETIQRAYGQDYANVHRGLHYLSNLSTANFEKARESVRRFLNARSDAEIIFTRNATEAINLVASSYGVPHTGEGDEILLTIMRARARPRSSRVSIGSTKDAVLPVPVCAMPRTSRPVTATGTAFS